MSEIATLFRHCPNCGKRFEIRVTGKRLLDDKKETQERPLPYMPSSMNLNYAEVAENVPLIVDTKEFQYAYKCKHCGHQWSEVRTQQTEA